MTSNNPIYSINSANHEVALHSPTALPNACGFLWNKDMMIQMNCRGYASAQHMQPEPAKYSKGPALESTTFMQPEHHYYTDHPGRFFYVKLDDKPLFSMPYEPVKAPLENFVFVHAKDELRWHIEQHGLQFVITLSLAQGVVEHWSLSVTNTSNKPLNPVIYPMFSIGYLSWMNQSASYDASLQCIVAKSVTPYQKTQDYPYISSLKDITFFASQTAPDGFTCNYKKFLGEGHLCAPQGLLNGKLGEEDANYEVPVGVFQYSLHCPPGETRTLNWRFGAVNKVEDIGPLIDFEVSAKTPASNTLRAVTLQSPNSEFNDMVNNWLPRQLAYHGQMNRLTTDPQTRNFLQDSMGLIYLDAGAAKQNFLKAISQQHHSGAMPDGVLLHEKATLKYINQVPHSDHNVWLLWFLEVYINETQDTALFDTTAGFCDAKETASVYEHINRAMHNLVENLDERGLSLIKEGDWCDPMNMVGKDGKGVSAWLSMATSRAFTSWANLCHKLGEYNDEAKWNAQAKALNLAIEKYFWANNWYARGITDNGRRFGTRDDSEGSIYLNPQAWAMLALSPSVERVQELNKAVDTQLNTPFGPMMLAPAYTHMHTDIGRITQKSPGVAENGSVYNHAAAFYAAGLLEQGEADLAFDVLYKMLPRDSDITLRGQLPVYLPNYYRGAYYQYPSMAGRSSHLFNTGTVAWFYHCVVDGLLGLRGAEEGLYVNPQLPSTWHELHVTRNFRGHEYTLHYIRKAGETLHWRLDGKRGDSTMPLPKVTQTIEVLFS